MSSSAVLQAALELYVHGSRAKSAELITREIDALLATETSPASCSRESPLICAHGGNANSPLAVSNTLPAFQSAVDLGVACVETDVARTSDGQLVAVHVRELRELSNDPSAQAADFTWAEMQALHGPAGLDIPLVVDVIQLLQPSVPNITLDIKLKEEAGKEVDVHEMAQAVVDLIIATGCSHCLVWSKNDDLVRKVQALRPGQRCGFIVAADLGLGVDSDEQVLPKSLRPDCQVVGMHHAMADQASVQAVHANNQIVHAWTANTLPMMVNVVAAVLMQ
ncbi:hypothetical protein WJX73_001227 [Symbiochloris irregularis]|uniref:glycerophosphodiester phosphodiesterase n=1 Tax=Symbiochloris irregularis TaxID=706552 RepID=A0AAW1NN54_9CHLO